MKVCGWVRAPDVAVKVIVPAVNVPLTVESVPVPEFAPPDTKETPAGNAPAVIVGVGTPVAVTANVFADPVLNVALLALVNTGALLRPIVRLAEIAASPGTVVAPQVPSASIAAMETLLRLKT